MSTAAFDSIARRYDDLWTNSPIGRLQRAAVWRRVDPLFQPGESVLDLGCGTGEDALHLMEAGLRVSAIDHSPEMVAVARRRGVDARLLAIENIDQMGSCFDGLLSDFGALNCIEDLQRLGCALARLIRPQGFLVFCTMGRFCLWETAYYIARGQLGKAFRRLSPGGAPSSLGPRVFYPSVPRLKTAFRPSFELVDWAGVGVCVPPSYITGLSSGTLATLAGIDRRVAHWSGVRALSDHRLLVFKRT